jgi:glycosyltransferase involved in cell wall biosynthesis
MLATLARAGAVVSEHPAAPPMAEKIAMRLMAESDVWSRTRRRWLRRTSPDLVAVSAGDMYSGLGWMIECIRLNIPFVTKGSAHSEAVWPDDSRAELLRNVLMKARQCIFVSEANRRLVELQIGFHLVNARVMRSPYQVPWRSIPDWSVFEKSEPCRLACVGRLEPAHKGQDLLLQVMARDRWRSRPVEVSLFGTGYSDQTLKRLASLSGIGDRVHFRGHIADVEGIWRDHHALVLPSRYEGLPVALVEAMLCGRPAIVTDVAGNTEVVEDGVTGFVAKAATVELLDEAMERAWLRRTDWESMGRHAASRIRALVPQDPGRVYAEYLEGLVLQRPEER